MSNDAEKNWQGVLTINNNTSYKIDWFFTSGLGAVKHTKGHTVMTIQPGQQGATHTVTDSSRGFKSGSINYHLWFYTDKPKHAYMKGSVGFYYNSSSADRGDLTTQDIKMYGECNDIYTWWQTDNLTGDPTLPFSVFNPLETRNYNMTLTFSPQD